MHGNTDQVEVDTHGKPLADASSRPRMGPPHTVLIVEDDEGLAEVLGMRLGRQGFDVTIADHGERAIELARGQRPSVILLDLRLPDMDGFELCQLLIDDDTTCDIPVIIVSGLEQPDVIRRSRAAGCMYYVRKPYDPNALLILIGRALEEAEQH